MYYLQPLRKGSTFFVLTCHQFNGIHNKNSKPYCVMTVKEPLYVYTKALFRKKVYKGVHVLDTKIHTSTCRHNDKTCCLATRYKVTAVSKLASSLFGLNSCTPPFCTPYCFERDPWSRRILPLVLVA